MCKTVLMSLHSRTSKDTVYGHHLQIDNLIIYKT